MKTIRSRILLSFCLMLFGFGMVFSTIYYLNLRHQIIKGFDERLYSHATDIAGLLDVEAHENLLHADQMESEFYQKLYTRLNRLMKTNGLAYIFTIRHQDGHWIYVLDSGEGEDHLVLGTVYNEGDPLDPEEIEALAGSTVVSSIYTSKYGTFKSAYTPLRNDEGEVVGLLVVDIEASTIAATLRSRLLTLVGFETALFLLLMVVAVTVSNSITKPLHKMADLATRISDGDLDAAMAMERHDEIGTVSHAIDTMVKRLKEMIAEREKTAGELSRFNRSLEELVEERTKALTESEARYRFLTDHAFIGIYLISDDHFRYVNPTFAKNLGYSREEMTGMKVIDLIHPDDKELYHENLRLRMEGEPDHVQYTIRLLTREKTVTTLEVFGARIEYEGKLAFYGTARDITEHLHLEEMLRRSQRLEGLGQMAGGIAHEFNNLLSPIVGYAALLKNRLSAVDRENLLRPLTMIEKAGERSAALVQQILTFARKSEVNFNPVGLNDVVEDTLALLRQTIPRTIIIRKELSENLPLVEADAGQIQSALLNLCLNARDAMTEGGTLTLGTRRILLGPEFQKLYPQCPPGEYVQMTVRDTGIGIDPETLSQIFDPFFTTKKDRGGNGLGLSTAYGTLQSHKGQLTVDSVINEGTVFNLYLPATLKTMKEPVASTVEMPAGNERLLVVDDDPDVRSLYSDLLKDLGYDVVEAEDGAVAMDILVENSIRLVILDLNMPRMDGRQVLKGLRKTKPELPVVVTSGMGNFEESPLDEDGYLSILPKPFRIENLAQTIRTMLDRQCPMG